MTQQATELAKAAELVRILEQKPPSKDALMEAIERLLEITQSLESNVKSIEREVEEVELQQSAEVESLKRKLQDLEKKSKGLRKSLKTQIQELETKTRKQKQQLDSQSYKITELQRASEKERKQFKERAALIKEVLDESFKQNVEPPAQTQTTKNGIAVLICVPDPKFGQNEVKKFKKHFPNVEFRTQTVSQTTRLLPEADIYILHHKLDHTRINHLKKISDKDTIMISYFKKPQVIKDLQSEIKKLLN